MIFSMVVSRRVRSSRIRKRWALALLCLGLACRHPARAPTLEDSAREINAQLPARWRGKIEFVPGTIEAKGWRYRLLVPKGWPPSQVDGAVEPPDNDQVDHSLTFGFNNELRVSAQCGGDCGPVRDWRSASQDQMFHQFETGYVRGSILSDEQQPNGRLMIFQRSPEKGLDVKVVPGDKARLVVRAWWTPKEDRYHVCYGTLSDESFELAPAMAAACMTATATRVAAP
ncbi:MAG: hypothetical protein R3B48_28035 [Kofleriaceae bacterium]